MIAANKKITDYKENAGKLNEEVEEFKTRIVDLKNDKRGLEKQLEERQCMVDNVIAELHDSKQEHLAATEDLVRRHFLCELNANKIQTRQLKDVTKELETVNTEFQSYKIKAHTALQKCGPSSSGDKVVELEESNSLLQMTLR